jgi:hypothetical protein
MTKVFQSEPLINKTKNHTCSFCIKSYTTFNSLYVHCNRKHDVKLSVISEAQKCKFIELNKIRNKVKYRNRIQKQLNSKSPYPVRCGFIKPNKERCEHKRIGVTRCECHPVAGFEQARLHGSFHEKSFLALKPSLLNDIQRVDKFGNIVFYAAGAGVFALRPIQKGDVITQYCGPLLNKEEYLKCNPHYTFECPYMESSLYRWTDNSTKWRGNGQFNQ